MTERAEHPEKASTPLIPAYVTLILRRLNDIGKNRFYALFMLVPMGLGMISLLWLCGRKSANPAAEDFSVYQSLETRLRILLDSLKNAMAVYPFIYLIYMGIKLVQRSGIVGANAALFSINLLIGGPTILGIYKPKVEEAIPFLVTLKS